MWLILLIRFFFFFQAEDGIRDAQESRGLGDVYKRQYQRRVRGGNSVPWLLVAPVETGKCFVTLRASFVLSHSVHFLSSTSLSLKFCFGKAFVRDSGTSQQDNREGLNRALRWSHACSAWPCC
eukprot:TRINITY_DN16792_c0_g1_i1.p2 TRINITY_DN16792_c0_g1~~TRINITY_DN16792_c0_g1_i1.p2  ORF type:complete len:123 (+),score=22.26 TRINITY_DN16792_c0_g1_i1:16-384(+)